MTDKEIEALVWAEIQKPGIFKQLKFDELPN